VPVNWEIIFLYIVFFVIIIIAVFSGYQV
jgi:hypothetical protein